MWHPEVLEPATEATIRTLTSASFMRAFYLAGGTGLALRLGHRRSMDLDFFSQQPVDEEALLRDLQRPGKLSVISKAKETLEVHLSGTRVSFMSYPYPLLFPFDVYAGLHVADARDIACMKVSAVSSRGTRRDFTDLYVVSKIYGLGELVELFEKKYSRVGYNRVHVLKSLTFFEDAEKDPPPAFLMDFSWEELKKFFLQEVRGLI